MKPNEIFERLVKIEPKVVSIETLFNNTETLKNTKYDPDYQRNYVWDDDKATYFIESILLGTEIPPIIYFRSGDKLEVIDGRQRYQTILRFIKNDFKLKQSGLHKLDRINITGKTFDRLGALKDDFWDTKLRIIEFSFHSQEGDMEVNEDIVKKEIFKRYNSGITPLKSTEIDKAAYYEDDFNTYLHEKLTSDEILFGEIRELFHYEKNDIEIILKKIRQLFVQHKIPIKYYATKKDSIISRYYEILSSELEEDDFDEVYSKFIEKINILKAAKENIIKNGYFFNRLVSECLFWALSIIEEEFGTLSKIDKTITAEFSQYIENNKNHFELDRSSFNKQLQNRYSVTATYFEDKLKMSFADYLVTTPDFLKSNKDLSNIKKSEPEETSFDDLRINKPEPSSITIVDICRQMERQRFLIRPPYQRAEVKNRNKSSAIIESILLGIKLPPIFVYKRKDGVSEVLDGQQRLLSILGFLKKSYIDENNKKQLSNKNGYSLNLRNGILSELQGLNVDQLTSEQIKKINNFDLWIIEINHRYNKDFEPIDLFLRLNTKPYPIKENTFEMWNSYIDKNIIMNIKEIIAEHGDWFYFRKNNKRMENENTYAALSYLQYCDRYIDKEVPAPLEYYKTGERISFRIKSKTEITKLLENASKIDKVLRATNYIKDVFINKIRIIVTDPGSNTPKSLNENLEDIFGVSSTGRRTQQSFYALWYFISKIDTDIISEKYLPIRNDLTKLFSLMNDVPSKEKFTDNIETFWKKYSGNPNEK